MIKPPAYSITWIFITLLIFWGNNTKTLANSITPAGKTSTAESQQDDNVFNGNFEAEFYDSWLIPASQLNKSRLVTVAATQAVGFTTTLVLLDRLWYRDHPRSAFNFHDDLPDWLQMDKLGHSTTAYHLSRLSAGSFRWSGLDNSQSAWYGTIAGVSFLTVVEILDGFSTGWGFSVADFAANKVGAATFLSQQLTWQQQKIKWKFSFSPSGLATYRPDVLGNGFTEEVLKDYNGQTYWLSANLHSLSGGNDFFPQWLNIALGHSANGMLGSRNNPQNIGGLPAPHFERHRQWIISADIDWERIPVRSPFLKTIFTSVNFIKMPAPAIEYNRVDGWKLHLLFF